MFDIDGMDESKEERDGNKAITPSFYIDLEDWEASASQPIREGLIASRYTTP